MNQQLRGLTYEKLIGHGDWPSAKSPFSALIPGLFALGTQPLAAAETQTSIKLAGDAGLCLHIPGGNTQDHSQLALVPYDASNPAQAFDKDGSVFSSRMAPNQVLDASGEQAGAALILYHHHGDSNQKWKSSL
ncbi:RICIN domain-containing protein [Shewanella carassii]|uniref:RICIN domain-containing protein n=1 Tax=Shewanella carassii TaxID=1987584 RepID=UPI0012FFFA41|nr:RICIN domain-containing protein [Shewanella carassii]